MRLSAAQIEELLEITDKYVTSFMFHHIGDHVLTNREKQILSRSGISANNIKRTAYNVQHAFKFGILSDALEQSIVKNMNYASLKNILESGKVFKLNTLEQSALQSLEIQMAGEMRRLTSNIKTDMRNALVSVDKVKNTVTHSPTVLNAAKKAIENRKYVTEVISEIGTKTGKWGTDLGRIADYVMHTAFDEGRGMNVQRERGPNALVYKDVYPGACPHCMRLLLTGGVGSQPILFSLADLKANGTNVGRKAKEWKAVLGPVHPWCRCTLQKAPFGMTMIEFQAGKWEWNGEDFVKTELWKPKVARKSKVKISIGDKKIEV